MSKANGFYGHIRRNDLRSAVMFLGFLAACQLIGLAIMVGPLLFFDEAYGPVNNFSGYMGKYGIVVLGLSLLLFLVRFFLHTRYVRDSVDFRYVTVQQEPRLCKIIEIQAIAAGIEMPGVGVIENDARNAFACGMRERNAVVVVTRGLLWALDDEELEAVVAHEITHIVNGDIRLMAVANVMLSTLFLLKNHNPIRIESNRQILLIILMPPMLFLFLLTGFVTSVAMTIGKLSRLLIASSREFIADAEAVRMTKNPAALISALQKIGGYSTISDLDETVDAMMIDGAVEGAYASHPTIAERIAVLKQHAGAMVTGPRTVKDTRTSLREFGIASNGTFGQARPNVQMSVPETRKGLIDRVNADSGENAFGLSPKMRNYLLLALGGIALFTYWNVKSAERILGNLALTSAALKDPFMTSGIHRLGGATAKGKSIDFSRSLYQITKQFEARDAVAVRCFATGGYKVGDRELHDFTEPDEQLVSKYLGTRKMPSGVQVEKYAAIRLKSHYPIYESDNTDELDKALSIYANRRGFMLMTMHRFFGEDGLKWMLAAYESERDKEIVGKIKARLAQGAVLGQTKNKQREIALLVKDSTSYVPCYYRAILERDKRKRAADNISDDTQPPQRLSLRGSLP